MVGKKKKRAQLPFRLNILFFVIFLLFAILIVQLGVVQILNGEAYQKEIDRTIKDTTKIPVPRGKMLDRHHQVIVDNKPLYSITYTPAKGVQAKDRLIVAKELSKYMSMDIEMNSKGKPKGISLRDRQEYWYLENEEEATSRLSDEEKTELKDVEQYNEILKRIKKNEVSDYSEAELKIILIKKELDKAYSLTPQIVKNKDVTPEEYARVAEHLDSLPGVNATTDWNRHYPYEETFASFLGTITSQEQGILADKEAYYLTRGYNRNDRVGRSGLEEQYEGILRGRKEQIQYTTNKTGKVIDSKVIVPGERGKDLVLTIDMELQERVDEVVREELRKTIQKYPYPNRFLKDAIAVLLDPKTGEILAVSGQHHNKEDNTFESTGFKALYDAHRPGSSIKGATVLAGYESGVIAPYETIYDTPMKIGARGPMKGSYRALGMVNDSDALKLSSNVYMFNIALRMGGEYNYRYGQGVKFNKEAFQEMRNYYSQFGLGVHTGIDFPFESTGFKGTELKAGLLMDFAIGQYDTFTAMQLAQYVSTIANDGYRVRPHFLKEIREPTPYKDEVGPVKESINKQVLNRVDMDESNIKRVQEGFRRVFQESGGTGASHWAKKTYSPAGKTGTAENDVYVNKVKTETENLTLVGYAPFDEPEVAFAVIVPNLGKVRGQNPVNHTIGTGILDAYFDLKKERAENGEADKTDEAELDNEVEE